MKVVIVTSGSYPFGMACTQRIHLLARGIIEAGGEVKVLILNPEESDATKVKDLRVRGNHDGVEFEHVGGKILVSSSFFVRRWSSFKNHLMAAWTIWKAQSRFDALFLYMVSLPTIVLFKVVALSRRAVYLTERTEYPYLCAGLSLGRRLRLYSAINLGYRLFDGMLVISEPLRAFFERKLKRSAEILTVPILCDPLEFKTEDEDDPYCSLNRREIVYSGEMSETKDGFLTLLRAFALVHATGMPVKLLILGEPGRDFDKAAVTRLVRDLNVEENIVFTGYIPRKHYVTAMKNATLLVLAKPRSLQNEYCMPTKVAEYLMTGRPALLTKVGELAQTLTDGQTAFFAQPASARDLADKITKILGQEELARKVGRAGRAYAVRHYDCRLHGRRIVQFIERLGERHPKEKAGSSRVT